MHGARATTHVVIFATLVLVPGCRPDVSRARAERAEVMLRQACAYLWSKQNPDGGWHSETHGLLRSGQALTPFVLHALLQVDASRAPRDPAAVARALDFIRQSVDGLGRIGLSDPEVPEYPTYATALGLRCLVAAENRADHELIARMRSALVAGQLTTRRGVPPTNPAHGAWGFGGARPRGGSPGHVDVSYTRHVLEALRAAGPLEPSVTGPALHFLHLVQRHPADPRSPATGFDGGFYLSPVVVPANKGGAELAADGTVLHYRSYATATCEGLLALLAAGVADDDERVLAARAWLDRHPDLEHAGGIPADDPSDWASAVFYYHLAVRGEVAAALERGATLRAPLVALLEGRQDADGSFTNPRGALMKEDDPILATTLAVIALASSAADR